MIKRTHVILEEILKDKISGEWGKPDLDGTGIQIIRTTNFTNNGKLDLSDVAIRQISKSLVERKKLRNGDIILEKSGGSDNQPVGRVVFFDAGDRSPYLCNNFTQVLRADENLIRPKYLFYYLFYIYKLGLTERFQNKTTGIRNLKTERYLAQKVPLLPFEEQDRIIFTIQQVESALAKRRETLRLADEFLKSAFIDMFGDPINNPSRWKTKELEEVCEKITDGEHGTVKRCESGPLYLMARNVSKDGKIDLNEVSHIPKEDLERINKRCNPESGDILLVCVGATIGKLAIVPKNFEPFGLARSVALLKPNHTIIKNLFLYELLKNEVFQKVLLKSRNTSAQAGLYLNSIKKIKIMCPPMNLQQKFYNLVQKVEALKEKQKQSETELQNLFNCLMQKAFKGELF